MDVCPGSSVNGEVWLKFPHARYKDGSQTKSAYADRFQCQEDCDEFKHESSIQSS